MSDVDAEFWEAELEAARSAGKCPRCDLQMRNGNFYGSFNPPCPAPPICECLAAAEAALVKERERFAAAEHQVAEVRALLASHKEALVKAEAERDEARRDCALLGSSIDKFRIAAAEAGHALDTERSLRVEAEKELRVEQGRHASARTGWDACTAALAAERAKREEAETAQQSISAAFDAALADHAQDAERLENERDAARHRETTAVARAARAERVMGELRDEAGRTIAECPVDRCDGTSAYPCASCSLARRIITTCSARLAEWEAVNGSESPPPTIVDVYVGIGANSDHDLVLQLSSNQRVAVTNVEKLKVETAKHERFVSRAGESSGVLPCNCSRLPNQPHRVTCTSRIGESSGGKP